MKRRILSRCLQSVLTFLVVVVLSFLLQKAAPGGPFDTERELSAETIEALNKEWLLDRPTVVQLGDYMKGLVSWPPDLKRSMTRPGFTVGELIAPRLAVSLSLGVVVLLISLYLFLVLWALRIASQAKDRFGAVVAVGVGAMIFWQTVVNLGMVSGLLPVVGMTLPLFSYGGSSLLSTMLGLGLLMNVSMRRFSH